MCDAVMAAQPTRTRSCATEPADWSNVRLTLKVRAKILSLIFLCLVGEGKDQDSNTLKLPAAK
jgi:hypothetical protein